MEIKISGTLIWYYYICNREVWLIFHQLTPDQDDTNLLLGRFLSEDAYPREKKEIMIGSSKIDVFQLHQGELLIGEIKKSSKYSESARMQLAFYLKELLKHGVRAKGELRFPREKKRESVILDDTLNSELEQTEKIIREIVVLSQPPPPKKNRYCRHCAYNDFCWS